MDLTGASLGTRIAMTGAVGVALCTVAAGPASASTVGLLKASQLPSGYSQIGKTLSISGSAIVKQTKSLGGGLGGAVTTCKGAPSASSLSKYKAHIAIFEKGDAASSVGILGEVVYEAPNAASATHYFDAVQAATAHCSGTQTVSMSGATVKVSYATHSVSIAKSGADQALGSVVALTAKTTVQGVAASVAGSLGIETYRKGADIVEVIVDNFKVNPNASTKSVAVTFSPGSSALVSSVGKAAIKDL